MDKEFQYGRIEDLVELKEYLLKFAKKKKQYIKIIILDNYFIGARGYVLGQLVNKIFQYKIIKPPIKGGLIVYFFIFQSVSSFPYGYFAFILSIHFS